MVEWIKKIFGFKQKEVIPQVLVSERKEIQKCKKCESPATIANFCNSHLEEWINQQDENHKQ
jgi:hypothetical protein